MRQYESPSVVSVEASTMLIMVLVMHGQDVARSKRRLRRTLLLLLLLQVHASGPVAASCSGFRTFCLLLVAATDKACSTQQCRLASLRRR